jgi:hypothetical protein
MSRFYKKDARSLHHGIDLDPVFCAGFYKKLQQLTQKDWSRDRRLKPGRVMLLCVVITQDPTQHLPMHFLCARFANFEHADGTSGLLGRGGGLAKYISDTKSIQV